MAASEQDRPRALLVARRGRFLVGEPLFERGPQLPLAKARNRIREGRIALCRIDRRGARPIADLGRADKARDVVGALLADRGLRATFPDRIEREASEAAARLAADPGPRRDLTALATFTVDPATARDFDDAVSATREGDGFRLWIHIADVAAHVQPGSELDRFARERANSTYAPGHVCPMLPRTLSDEACSLNPGVERLAVTAEIELSAAGVATATSFYRSVIRSDERLDYDQLDEIFAGRSRPSEAVAEPLEIARAAAAAIAATRHGGLDVSGAEPEFTFSGDGDVESARALEQTEAHRLIEQLMILTNEQVAALLERKGVPMLYRVHEQPDPTRIAFLIEQLASLDLPTPPLPDRFGPRDAGRIASEASVLVAREAARRGHGGPTLSGLILRAMKPARYSDENLGHAGLASSAYAHFTSPIRRYPDLIAHRALLSAVDGSESRPDRHEVAAAAEHCSDRERESMRIERDGDDICLAFLLERELFERGWETSFEGEVSGVIGAGAFVRFAGEHANVYEGFLPARRVRGDRYELNELDTALVGVRSARRLGFGDRIEVCVDGVEAPRGRVDLAPPEEDESAGGSGRSKALPARRPAASRRKGR